MSIKTKWFIVALAAALPVLGGGCGLLLVGGAAAAAGVGTYAYVNGELRGTEAAPLDKVWDASQAAMKDMQFPVVTKTKDALEGLLTARTAADKKVQVTLKKLSDSSTEIRIRVGTFGDEAISRMIMDKIKSHL
jgi:Protein of unknown function (DUF3568)